MGEGPVRAGFHAGLSVGLSGARSPHFRATPLRRGVRKVLFPQLRPESGAAASSAEVGAPTPASIVRDYILLFNSSFQNDPLTKEHMQLLLIFSRQSSISVDF